MATRSRASSPQVLLFPGAGTDSNHSSLLAIERAVAPRPCRRADFPYRLAGRRAPDRAPVLMAAVRAELDRLEPGPVVIGGRSMGGRMCSMVVAGVDGEPPPPQVVGLVLVCYPLHPPGKPDALRVEHLPAIEVPCLFVSGTKDAFGTPDELTSWSATVAGPVTHVWIEGKGHDLRGADDAVADAVATWIGGLTGTGRRSARPRG